MLCPCKSKKDFKVCCELIIVGKQQAESPQELMRSRYSAYATNNAKYIFDTYAKSNRNTQSLSDIEAWAKETTWLSLKIIQASKYDLVEYPTVTFEAVYKHNNQFFMMNETSRFINEDKAWRYIDGNNLEHTQLVPAKRNDPCLCNSGNKFKKCCSN